MLGGGINIDLRWVGCVGMSLVGWRRRGGGVCLCVCVCSTMSRFELS